MLRSESPHLLRQLEGLSLVSRRRLATYGQGDRRSPLRGSSMELVDFRPYTPGDDLRQVDWNAYGRSGELFVRLYEDERVLNVHLLIDVSESMDWGSPNKREAALQLASALSYVAISGYDRVYLGFLAERVQGQEGPFWGHAQRAAALSALAAAPRGGQTDFAASLAAYVDRLRQPGLLIFLTDLLSPTAEEGLRRLATPRHEAVVLHLLAPQELDPEPAEDLQLVDRETGRSVEVSLDLATVARYRQRLNEWGERLARLCRERSARYVRLSTADKLDPTGLRTLRQQGVLR
jgi:uncharacterized protein (DUF58 family)